MFLSFRYLIACRVAATVIIANAVVLAKAGTATHSRFMYPEIV
jgi:hypothetical protein